uniref:HRC101 n=1 Tax=Saccharomyces cerevisiae TaxID=4932 RepID=E9PAD0_YEASX|nr:HRC101 [Saccharomyces cerevisiae]
MFVGVLCECSRTSGNVGRMVLGWHLDRIRRPVQNPRSPQDHWLLRHHVGTYPERLLQIRTCQLETAKKPSQRRCLACTSSQKGKTQLGYAYFLENLGRNSA